MPTELFPRSPVPSTTADAVRRERNGRRGVGPKHGKAVAGIATNYAGFWKRFFAGIIDALVVLLGAMITLFFIFIGVAIAGGSTDSSDETTEAIVLLFLLFHRGVSWLYFAILEASPTQGTLGKIALSIKVTDLNGQPIGFGKATGRYFAKLLSSLLFVGYVMIGVTQKKQGLHDMVSGCLVVDR